LAIIFGMRRIIAKGLAAKVTPADQICQPARLRLHNGSGPE
jgi:hypothetical protein